MSTFGFRVKRCAAAIWPRLPSNTLRRFLLGIIANRYFVSAVGVVLEGEKVLLLKHAYDLKTPWGLPSGHIHLHETFQNTLKREFEEEIGLEVTVGPLVTVVQEPDEHSVSVAFLCNVVGGHARPSAEVEEASYFALSQLPKIRPVQVRVIAEAVRLLSATPSDGKL